MKATRAAVAVAALVVSLYSATTHMMVVSVSAEDICCSDTGDCPSGYGCIQQGSGDPSCSPTASGTCVPLP